MTHLAHYHSPFGCFKIEANDHAITAVQLLQNQEAPPEDWQDAPEHIVEAVRQLSEYFHRQRIYPKSPGAGQQLYRHQTKPDQTRRYQAGRQQFAQLR